MKKLITIAFALLLIHTLATAQDNPSIPRNSLKFGLGTTFLKPDNYFGNNTMYLQYEHRLFKPVSLAFDGFRINAAQTKSDGHEQSTKAYQLDAGLNIVLFSNNTNAFKIGGGASWQTADKTFTTSVERDTNGQVVNKTFGTSSGEQFGWTASLSYELYVAKHIVLGSRLTYKQYEDGDKNYFFGLNAGFRF